MTVTESRHQQLAVRIVHPTNLLGFERHQMWGLFSRYYENVDREMFDIDLADKDLAFLLEVGNDVVGFTTASFCEVLNQGKTTKVIFSGDTIVDQPYWGEFHIAKAWLGEMGRLYQLDPMTDHYWFLIVKGHRTFRYLPIFAHDYVPNGKCSRNSESLLELRNFLALDRFGEYFNASTGIIRFSQPRGNLQADWAEPSARELKFPEVQFFLQANPDFREGDELACLCSLSPKNMKPLARRWFDAGRNAA